MGRKNLFENCFPIVESFFDRFENKAFSKGVLYEVFGQFREEWKIPINKQPSQFIAFLQKKGALHTTIFSNTKNQIKVVYSWKTNDDYTIMSGIKKGVYYSHYTAMYMHQLTLQVPKTFYLNYEHSPDKQSSEKSKLELVQDVIDKVFATAQRKTTMSYTFNDRTIIILNGKNTGRLGVVKYLTKDISYEYTDLERTIIDISIRPVYAGGVFEVLEAYKKSKRK